MTGLRYSKFQSDFDIHRDGENYLVNTTDLRMTQTKSNHIYLQLSQ